MATMAPTLTQAIRQTHDTLLAQGALRPTGELETYYQRFSARFGPEHLSPEDVLAAPSDPHSLAFWLTQKDDDELPGIFGETRPLGRTGFGLWFDPEQQTWRDGSKVRLTDGEAIAEATRMRDELLDVVDMLATLPTGAGDDEYAGLQSELEARHPNLVHLDFVHKYLSLLFPNRLDQFHLPIAGFVLIQCLQTPPSSYAVPRLYVTAGRFVAMAEELDMPMNHLCQVLTEYAGQPRGYRLWATTEHDWLALTKQGVIALPWPAQGVDAVEQDDLAPHDRRVLEALPAFYPEEDPATIERRWRLIRWRTSPGDLVLAHDGGRALGIATITGDHHLAGRSELTYRVPMAVIDSATWSLPEEDAQPGFVKARPEVAVMVEERLLH